MGLLFDSISTLGEFTELHNGTYTPMLNVPCLLNIYAHCLIIPINSSHFNYNGEFLNEEY